MQLTGKVLSVDTRNLSETTTADRAAGSTTLPVTDASSFDSGGGTVVVEGVPLTYISADYDLDVLTLEVPLSVAVPSDSLVEAYPASPERIALVDFGGQGEASPVVVPFATSPLLNDGIRTPEQQETVYVERREDGALALLDLLMQPAVLTVEALKAAPTTDGLAPTSSPTPTVVGGIGAIAARWTPLTTADPVHYEVHLGTDSAFTVGAGTLIVDTTGFSATIRTLPNGAPLAYDVTYWVRVVAIDDDGRADPSPSQGAQLMRVTSADIAANYVYAGTVNAAQINGGSISSDLLLAGSIKTAPSGARVELGAFGLVAYDSAGNPGVLIGTDGQASFRGQVQATTLTVTDGMSLRGTANEISRSASLTLSTGSTASSNAPSVVVDYSNASLLESTAANGSFLSLTPYSFELVGGQWVVTFSDGTTRVFALDGTFVGTVGAIGNNAKRSTTEIAAGAPLYYISSSGKVCRDEHRINGVEQRQIDDPLTSLAGWATVTGSPAVEAGGTRFPAGLGTTEIRNSTVINMQGHDISADVAPSGPLHATQAVGLRAYFSSTDYVQAETYTDSGVTKLRMRVVKNGVAPALTTGVVYNPTSMLNLVLREDEGLMYLGTRSGPNATINYQGSLAHTFSKATLSTTQVRLFSQDTGTNLNLITNPTFETDTSGWTGSSTANSTLQTSSAAAHGGTKSMQVTAVAAGDAGATSSSASDAANLAPAVTQGVTYSLSWWGRTQGVTARQMSARFYWYDKTGAYLSATSIDGPTADNTAWVQQTATATPPANAAFVGWRLYMRNLNAGEAFYMDDVALTYPGVSTLVDTARVRWVDSVSATLLNYSSVIDNDGTNLIACTPETGNTRLRFDVIDPGTMDVISTSYSATNAAFGSGFAISALRVGTFDFAAARYLVKQSGSGQFWAFDSTGALVAADGFPSAPGGSAGFDYDGSVFVELGTNSRTYRHTAIVWAAAGLTMSWSAAFTWYDGNSAGTGLHETTPSPRATFAMNKRARLTITSPDIPNLGGTDDPDRIGVYLSNSGSGTLYQQLITAAGAKTAVLSSAIFSGTAAPTTNNFPGATPAQIVSSDGSLAIKADGTFKAKTATVEQVVATLMPIGRMTKNTAQTIANATATVVTWDTQAQLSGITYDSTNSRYVVTRASRYSIVVALRYSATPAAAGRVEGSLLLNGAVTATRTLIAPAASTTYPTVTLEITRDLVVGDTVQFSTYQTTGSYATHTQQGGSYFEIVALY